MFDSKREYQSGFTDYCYKLLCIRYWQVRTVHRALDIKKAAKIHNLCDKSFNILLQTLSLKKRVYYDFSRSSKAVILNSHKTNKMTYTLLTSRFNINRHNFYETSPTSPLTRSSRDEKARVLLLNEKPALLISDNTLILFKRVDLLKLIVLIDSLDIVFFRIIY